MATIYLDQAETGPIQVNLGNVIADIEIVTPNPNADPGYTVRRTWVIDPVAPGTPSQLNGKVVRRTWGWPGTPEYLVGSDISAPMPDKHWDALYTTNVGGFAEATLSGVPDVDPFLLVLASKP